ncbi:hypothetical protein PILCRDRAFT_6328 [Piloderma croceum F 1598]|uniref:Uncharacterized protein n=1 Tax=Piloderma croceum (strain F 1598) TaxID=765440 RepID=A0A0C3FKY6_PILCF|nr:hypothetical protein PILCRDRAFT_6328 [Piloderma croceum F 1598]
MISSQPSSCLARSLEELVQAQSQAPSPPPPKPIPAPQQPDSVTQVSNEWKKSVEGQWSGAFPLSIAFTIEPRKRTLPFLPEQISQIS